MTPETLKEKIILELDEKLRKIENADPAPDLYINNSKKISKKELIKLLDKVIEANNKQNILSHHSSFCNYDIEYNGKTFCNCGLSDLIYAAKLAKELKGKIK